MLAHAQRRVKVLSTHPSMAVQAINCLQNKVLIWIRSWPHRRKFFMSPEVTFRLLVEQKCVCLRVCG